MRDIERKKQLKIPPTVAVSILAKAAYRNIAGIKSWRAFEK
jgi:hypothetical protein